MKKGKQKKDWGLVAIILVGILAFAGIGLWVARSLSEAPGEVVILPAATPIDEIVALGYESHLTGMFVELFMGAEVQDTIVVTTADVISVTGTYQALSSVGNVVTCTLAAAAAPGRYTGVRNVTYTTGSLLWLVNTSATVITVTEGSTAQLSGASTPLGQYDDLLMFFDGDYWVELAQADN